LPKSSIACNGEFLVLFEPSYRKVFSAKTGQLLNEQSKSRSINTFDVESSLCYDMDVASYSWLKKTKLIDFKHGHVTKIGLPQLPIIFDEVKANISAAIKAAGDQEHLKSNREDLLIDLICGGK